MMNNELDQKAKVALNLMSQGADEVKIIGTDITVKRRGADKKVNQRQVGNIEIIQQVSSQATASTTTNLATYFSIVRHELRDIYKRDRRLSELEEKLADLENELLKSKPNEGKLKTSLHWILDFGFKAFLKVIPIILDKIPKVIIM